MKTFQRLLLSLICILAASCKMDVTLDPTTFRPITFATEAQLDEQVAGYITGYRIYFFNNMRWASFSKKHRER
ncbi:hypothetical protein [Chitinophaga polysaccharea]|uniref:hypothetical protein n=1 Tax=Chitinophaga polysaccharea TaxID=1293035 RepID=UPI001158832B|nr:hypothetical protein [Chitinophaga polysaccharea]